MKTIGDLTGQRFGNLVVKRCIGKTKHYEKLWECECDCLKTTVVRQGHLRSGHTTSCGCNKNTIKSLIGKRFGNLVVKERAEDYICPGNGKHYVQWLCECDCGEKTTVVASNLMSGNIKSCGCQRFQDLSGQTFGDLTVIKQIDSYINPSGRKLIRYECECKCKRRIEALANTLRSGDVTSCGCSLNSKGEMIVSQWLKSRGIDYELHKSFSDCLSTAGYKLNFDFYIPEIHALVECNGIQHYEPVEFFGGQEQFELQQKYDSIKENYAKTKGFKYLVLDCRRNNLSSIELKLSKFFN